jgi:hypothetical protein
MPYATLATHLRPGHPKERADEASIGNLYLYRATTTIINANKPAIGDDWADGRPVVATECYELSAASAISELIVITAVDAASTGSIASELETTEYELDWRPVVKPLEVHPDFRSGGTYAIDATARKHILGWKAELDPDLKSQRKYKALDSEGEPSGTETTISGNALEFIKLHEAGVEEFIDYMPVWRKRSIYKGTAGPSTAAIGIKTATPSGSGYPSGYEWVKSRDRISRVGRAAKWQRDEEWEGAITVYADKVDVFPPA